MTLPRRLVLGGLAAASASTVASSFLSPGRAAAPASSGARHASTSRDPGLPPSFLVVLVDDLGRGEVGAYGQDRIETPVLDRLAEEGVRFTQAYATPICAPTRASLLTGLHPGHARVQSNKDAVRGLRMRDVTVAQVLRQAGYRTGLVGKWGLGPENGSRPSHPNNQGFEHFFGYLNQQLAHDYWPEHLWRDHQRLRYPENRKADVTYAPDLFTADAVEFLDRVGPEEPFFLVVAPTTPHAPNEIPSDAPYHQRPWPRGERNHAAQVTATDAQIGRLLQALADRGRADDTVVLVLSDNGPHHEGRTYSHVGSRLAHDVEFFDSNGRLRGAKRDLYEGGIRIPLIARLPGGLGGVSGVVADRPVAVWDVPATLAELAGLPVPRALDGISFAPEMRGERGREHDYLYWQFTEDGFDEAVRFGSWKGLRRGRRGRTELYQLNRDPRERRDVARQFPSVVRRAERLMAQAVR